MPDDYAILPQSDLEAQQRYDATKRHDPFPDIPPSLLNSADVFDYVRTTGMLHPFRPENLKPASYEAAIRGRCIWWDDRGERRETILVGDDQEFRLRANSIAFVQVEPFFRLPHYVALRFNLKITQVHRGILLGTGPLVDPGFAGRLLIPLHNLTTNDYSLKAGEGLIWIEFTKTSPLPAGYIGERPEHLLFAPLGEFHEFPENKKQLQPEHYLTRASPHSPIRSSIPEAMAESRKAATDAEASAQSAAERAERAGALVGRLSGLALLVFLVTLGALGYSTWSLIQDTWSIRVSAMQQDRSRRMEEIEARLRSLDGVTTKEMQALRDRIEELQRELQRVRRGRP